MLFGHFLLSLSSKYHHNYHWTVIMIIGIFSVIRAKRRFWRPKKDVQVARKGGGGKFGQCPKENILFYRRCSLMCKTFVVQLKPWNMISLFLRIGYEPSVLQSIRSVHWNSSIYRIIFIRSLIWSAVETFTTASQYHTSICQLLLITLFAAVLPYLSTFRRERALSERRGKPRMWLDRWGLTAVSCLLEPSVQKCRRRDLAQSHRGLRVWPVEDTLLTRARTYISQQPAVWSAL